MTSVGKTLKPSANSAPTLSARLTRRGRCVPGPPQDSCVVWSTKSWREATATPRISTRRRKRPPPSVVPLKAPRRRREQRAKQRAPREKPQTPEVTFHRAKNTKPDSGPLLPHPHIVFSQEPRHCTSLLSGKAADLSHAQQWLIAQESFCFLPLKFSGFFCFVCFFPSPPVSSALRRTICGEAQISRASTGPDTHSSRNQTASHLTVSLLVRFSSCI